MVMIFQKEDFMRRWCKSSVCLFYTSMTGMFLLLNLTLTVIVAVPSSQGGSMFWNRISYHLNPSPLRRNIPRIANICQYFKNKMILYLRGAGGRGGTIVPNGHSSPYLPQFFNFCETLNCRNLQIVAHWDGFDGEATAPFTPPPTNLKPTKFSQFFFHSIYLSEYYFLFTKTFNVCGKSNISLYQFNGKLCFARSEYSLVQPEERCSMI